MIRLLAILLLFFAQSFDCNSFRSSEKKTQKCVLSNGVNVVLYEDFRMPVVIVGLIFHTGSFDAPDHQKNITSIIAENFIDEITHKKMLDLGISYDVNVSGRYTEVIAKMNPKYITKFLQIMCENEFSLKNFNVLKKQLVINGNLAHNCHQNTVYNKVLTEIRYKNFSVDEVFNEEKLASITFDDVIKYFEKHYKRCHMSIVVSGAIGYKNLIKVLQSTICNRPPSEFVSNDVCLNQIFKEIYIENKYVSRSVRYFYKISSEDMPLERAFFRIFDSELLDFFKKSNAMISDYSCFNIISNGYCIRQIIFYPKPDVSLVDFQKAYDIFVDRICRREIAPDTLKKIKLLDSYAQQFLSSDLRAVYLKIRDNYLNGLDEKIDICDTKQFNLFGERILKQNLILKIVTKYKPDK
ncbi:MAG: hypothetical protein LBB21_01670 [Holosporaceae bacterium]|jgi:hypothetical protein|nr:hypothetical protein [Holosporaceae bacterium]